MSGGSPGGSPCSQGPDGGTLLVSYDDMLCFALGKLKSPESVLPDSFVTLVVTKSGTLLIEDSTMEAVRGNKLFVPYGCGRITSEGAEVIVCYPPKV